MQRKRAIELQNYFLWLIEYKLQEHPYRLLLASRHTIHQGREHVFNFIQYVIHVVVKEWIDSIGEVLIELENVFSKKEGCIAPYWLGTKL